ncbi:Hypothetical predicted protein [Pelobates cultripes]|uniref:Uncharacterized protein n=1 Tax=Pelobates cultripes TaxID=61616 RepID=A0AAD1WDN8_PELCU|nr:Hypothetical predicted protein [Pelobates cultripes]
MIHDIRTVANTGLGHSLKIYYMDHPEQTQTDRDMPPAPYGQDSSNLATPKRNGTSPNPLGDVGTDEREGLEAGITPQTCSHNH